VLRLLVIPLQLQHECKHSGFPMWSLHHSRRLSSPLLARNVWLFDQRSTSRLLTFIPTQIKTYSIRAGWRCTLPLAGMLHPRRTQQQYSGEYRRPYHCLKVDYQPGTTRSISSRQNIRTIAESYVARQQEQKFTAIQHHYSSR
jgi:hypothetical protein